MVDEAEGVTPELLLPDDDGADVWCCVTQGCASTSSVVNLSSGSFLKRHRIRHFALDEIESGIVNCPLRILANKPVCSWPWNGYLRDD